MTKLDEQIEALHHIVADGALHPGYRAEARAPLLAAIETLRLFRKFETPVRATLESCLAKEIEADPAVANVLSEFPDAKVSVRDLHRTEGE